MAARSEVTRKFSIRRTKDEKAVLKMHRLLFEDAPFDGDAWWFVWESGKDYPVGFCTARQSTAINPDTGEQDFAFLSRAGVLREARGCGLQKRMISVRERWAKAQGYLGCITYAAGWNAPSLINLLKAGYKIWEPEDTFQDGFVYLHHWF